MCILDSNFQKITSTSPPPSNIDIFNILHIQYQKKDASISIIQGKLFFWKKVAMYQKHLIVTPIPLKVNQSNNKTSE